MHMRSQSQMGTPGTATARNLQEIAPMPARSDEDALSTYAKGQPAPQPEEPVRPAHVVGAQGRRGILPSAAGRPPAPVGEELNDQKAVIIPPKDADGKYPCIHCDKTYLHAKHLKRHLLRRRCPSSSSACIADSWTDTGVRPYICGLCNDSFSRSDILKRHFNKCSARRGNPTGQSHLTHSRASKLKEKQEQQEAAIAAARDSQAANIPQSINGAHMMNGVQIPNAAQLAGYPPTSMDPQFDISSLTLNQSNSGGASNQVSRANSVTHGTRNTGSESQRTSFGMISPSGYDSAGYAQSTGHVTPDSITTSGAATPYTYPHESRTNQLSDNATFTQSPNGDPSFSASSRPAASSIYGFGPLPQIVNNENGRGYAATWPQPSLYGLHDDYESLHQSGTNPSAEPQPPKPMTLSHRTHNRS